MLKWLLIIGLVLGVLTAGGLIIGLTSQQPFMFGAAILCLSPLSAFFLGGATFSMASNYTISPKSKAAKGVAGVNAAGRSVIG
jgi:hypothetical protein